MGRLSDRPVPGYWRGRGIDFSVAWAPGQMNDTLGRLWFESSVGLHNEAAENIQNLIYIREIIEIITQLHLI